MKTFFANLALKSKLYLEIFCGPKTLFEDPRKFPLQSKLYFGKYWAKQNFSVWTTTVNIISSFTFLDEETTFTRTAFYPPKSFPSATAVTKQKQIKNM